MSLAKIKKYLEEEATWEELYRLYQDCASYDGSFDDIYNMDDIDDLLVGLEPSRILSMGKYGNFNPHDDYFMFNGYGNLESMSEYDLEDHIGYHKDDIIEHALELHEANDIDVTDSINFKE